jgi:hypothetical protein
MLTPDLGPRTGTRVRVVGKGRGTGWAGTVLAVGPSRWDGGLAWLVQLDNGTRVAKRRHQLQEVGS